MVNSLVAGLSGLRVHQQLIDIVGNNLANANTTGYKGSRATFSEILTTLLRQGTAPTTNIGGTNPLQLGLGVRLGTVDMNIAQGSFATTGRTFDMGLQGNGFFVLSNGTQQFYTRAGTFGLDSNSELVDLKNGFKVQSPTLGTIGIDTTGLFPPNITSVIDVKGNLPAKVSGPKQAILKTDSPFLNGVAAVVTGTNAQPFDFSAAGTESMTVSINGGAAVTVTFPDSSFATPATATATEVVNRINAELTSAGVSAQLVASVGTGNHVVLTTNATGTSATIKVTDGSGTPATILGLATTLEAGTQSAATTATLLNDMPDNTVDYVAGDKITITGIAFDGSQISSTFTYGSGLGQNGTDLGDLLTFINTQFSAGTGATATLDSSGNLVLTADAAGETQLSISILDDATDGLAGTTSFSAHTISVDQAGTGPDTAITSIQVFDKAGLSHNVTLTFTRRSDNLNSWDMAPSIDESDGSVDVAAIEQITFSNNGSFTGVQGDNTAIKFTFTGQAQQSIAMNFGTQGDVDGLTQFGDQTTAQAVSQDGYAPGTLSTISVREDGVIQGVYTNGQIQTLGAIAVATFPNPVGLERVADTLFSVTTNSGSARISAGQSGSAGSVKSGVLENSNVEVAEEFVRLVEAQRGFQASAKVIQTTDQLLGDLNNII